MKQDSATSSSLEKDRSSTSEIRFIYEYPGRSIVETILQSENHEYNRLFFPRLIYYEVLSKHDIPE